VTLKIVSVVGALGQLMDREASTPVSPSKWIRKLYVTGVALPELKLLLQLFPLALLAVVLVTLLVHVELVESFRSNQSVRFDSGVFETAW